MKLINTKKILAGMLLGIFTLCSAPNVMADENNDNDPQTTTADTSDSESDTVTAPATSQDAIGNMLLQSVSLMGIAYKWGGNTPDTGMDCSGFVRYVFNRSLGINLPRTAAEMAKVGKRISLDKLEPGDLIFFNTKRGSNTHIGIYLGNNKFIQSPRTGENIQISDLSGYWAKHFNGAKRVVQEDQDNNGNTTLQSYQNIRNEALPSTSSVRLHRLARGNHGLRRTHHATLLATRSKPSHKTAGKANTNHNKKLNSPHVHKKKPKKKAH